MYRPMGDCRSCILIPQNINKSYLFMLSHDVSVFYTDYFKNVVFSAASAIMSPAVDRSPMLATGSADIVVIICTILFVL